MMYKVTNTWKHGFENSYSITATNKSLKREIKFLNKLTWVKKSVIIGKDNEIIYQNEHT